MSASLTILIVSDALIILQRHVDRGQVLSTLQSTDDRRLSITLGVQLCAQHDDDWV